MGIDELSLFYSTSKIFFCIDKLPLFYSNFLSNLILDKDKSC